MNAQILLQRWAREGELPPSLAHPSQKQNLVVYTKDLTHLSLSPEITIIGVAKLSHGLEAPPIFDSSQFRGS